LIGYLLDTNVISEVGRSRVDPAVINWINAQPENVLFLSVLSLGEGDLGLAKLNPADAERVRLSIKWQGIEERFEGRILPVSNAIVRRWGSLSGIIKKGGKAAPVIDTLLAATAIEHNLYLVTRNTDDVRLTGAALFNPWKENPANFPLTTT
jgi:toxin FitB